MVLCCIISFIFHIFDVLCVCNVEIGENERMHEVWRNISLLKYMRRIFAVCYFLHKPPYLEWILILILGFVFHLTCKHTFIDDAGATDQYSVTWHDGSIAWDNYQVSRHQICGQDFFNFWEKKQQQDPVKRAEGDKVQQKRRKDSRDRHKTSVAAVWIVGSGRSWERRFSVSGPVALLSKSLVTHASLATRGNCCRIASRTQHMNAWENISQDVWGVQDIYAWHQADATTLFNTCTKKMYTIDR